MASMEPAETVSDAPERRVTLLSTTTTGELTTTGATTTHEDGEEGERSLGQQHTRSNEENRG